jgi:hypothetical protein
MIGIGHTFHTLTPAMQARVARWDAALLTGLRTIGIKVERGANQRLSGGGRPGSYPVPRRTGHLARSLGSQVAPREVVVFDSAEYAGAIHGGFRAFGNPHAPEYGPRPFLDDAAAAVDAGAELFAALEPVL